MPDDRNQLEYARPAPGPRRVGWLRVLIPAIGIAAVLAPTIAITLKWWTQRQDTRAMQMWCARNLHDVGVAIRAYAQEQHAWPEGLQDLPGSLTGQLVCPYSGDTPAVPDTSTRIGNAISQLGHCSYIYVGNGGIPAADPKRPLMIEDPASHTMEGGAVLFADGHVEWVDLPYLVQILSDVQSGRNPPSSSTNLTSAQAAKLYDTQLKPLMPQLKSGTLRFPTTAPTTRP